MSPDDIERIIEAGQEARTIEFKSAGAWSDPAHRGQITRSCVALANTRNGGVLLVGMTKDPTRPGYHVVDPLSATQRESFDPDVVIPGVNAHANPHIEMRIIHHATPAGSNVVVVLVQEFRDFPILCIRDIYGADNKVLAAKGRVLVRSRRNIETTELQDPEDFRELIDLAVDKGLSTYFRRRLVESAVTGPDDDELFNNQLGPIQH